MTLRRLISPLLITCVLAFTAARADEVAEVQRLATQGQTAAALQRAEAALKNTPADARLRFARALALLDLQRDTEAMRAFVDMTQDYPQLPEPFNNIAALHARAGQWDQARTALEMALRNEPTHALARENLGDVYLQLALQAWRAAALPARQRPELQRKIRLATQLAASPLFDGKSEGKSAAAGD